jgi:hypothetical protein
MDANQILSEKNDTKNGWKTFHIDKIDDARIMTPEEIRTTFQVEDTIDDDVHLTNGFITTPDFVRNWNYWFRIFLAQAPSKLDLK